MDYPTYPTYYPTWKHAQKYGMAVCERQQMGKYFEYAVISDSGPVINILDENNNIISIKDADVAIEFAEKAWDNWYCPEAEWWVWLAGWYDDCPEGLSKHY